MTWTYAGDPSNSTLEEVRFLIGDTDTTDQQLSDEEINYLIAKHITAYATAIHACLALVAKYSRKVDKSVGDLRIGYSKLRDHYASLAKSLRVQAVAVEGAATPYAGGLSEDDKDSYEEDTDRVQPFFRREMDDYNQPLSDLSEDD